MADTKYKIAIFNQDIEIGYIIFTHLKNETIYITSLYIIEKGKKYGTLLLILLICFIINNIDDSYFTKKIFLDDCSDLACTKSSIYYKMDYRILDLNSIETMSIKFLKPDKKPKNPYEYSDGSSSSHVHHKTILEYFNYLLKNNEDLLRNLTPDITFKIFISNDKEFIYKGDLNIFQCLKEKIHERYSLRKSN